MRSGFPRSVTHLLLALFLSALLPGCKGPRGDDSPASYRDSPVPEDYQDASEGGPLLTQDRFSLGLAYWYAKVDSNGKLSSSDRVGLVGGQFEWTGVKPDPIDGGAKVRGFLVEYIEGEAVVHDSVGGFPHRTTTLSRQAWLLFTKGTVSEPRAGPAGELEGYKSRVDTLIGLRVSSIEVSEKDGGSLEDESVRLVSPEFCLGVRGEWTVAGKVRLLARADGGLLPFPGHVSASLNLLGGLRYEPVRNLDIEIGWRFLFSAAAKGELFDAEEARVQWSGPYLGIEFRF
jgi:hypothetical protein